MELPVLEELDEQEVPHATFTEEEIDLAAFKLWREASQPESYDDSE